MRDFRIRGDFGFVGNLVVPDVLGPSCNDRFMKSTFRTEEQIVPYKFRPVLVLENVDIVGVIQSGDDQEQGAMMRKENPGLRFTRVARQVEVPPRV